MLLAYLAVSCVLFLVARYSPLPFPVLTPPPRVHLWELHGRGWGAAERWVEKPLVPNQRDGRGTQDLNHSAQLWTWHCPSIRLCPHPLLCAEKTGELVRICFCAPASCPSRSPVSSPPACVGALGERGGEEGGRKIDPRKIQKPGHTNVAFSLSGTSNMLPMPNRAQFCPSSVLPETAYPPNTHHLLRNREKGLTITL